MGFESFQVRLAGGSASAEESGRVIRSLAGVSRDDTAFQVRGSEYFLVRDGRHALEIELMRSPLEISCRFTLCHPPSVDAVFLGMIGHLMETLGMDAVICDAVPQHQGAYAPGQSQELAAAAKPYIEARRQEWKSMFGDRELGATTAEAHQEIILPQCLPVEKAG